VRRAFGPLFSLSGGWSRSGQKRSESGGVSDLKEADVRKKKQGVSGGGEGKAKWGGGFCLGRKRAQLTGIKWN